MGILGSQSSHSGCGSSCSRNRAPSFTGPPASSGVANAMPPATSERKRLDVDLEPAEEAEVQAAHGAEAHLGADDPEQRSLLGEPGGAMARPGGHHHVLVIRAQLDRRDLAHRHAAVADLGLIGLHAAAVPE